MIGRKFGLVGAVLLGIAALAGIVKACEIKLINFTPQPTAPKVDTMSAFFRTFADSNEGWDYHDGHFAPSPYDYALEISSNEPGFKAKDNAKYFNTPYGEFDLNFYSKSGGDYPKTLINKLKVRVTDQEGLEYRNVYVYDVADPCYLYGPIPKNGDSCEVILPDLVNPSPGIYANWDVITPPMVPGDCASQQGFGKLDGKINFYDQVAVAHAWLQETFEGENYNDGDLNYDGINDNNDLEFITGDNWLAGY